MNLSHPFRVARGQVVVDRDDVDAAAPRQSVEIRGKRCDKGFTFTRSHLSDLALVKNESADKLHVEVAHTRSSHARFAHNGEGFRQQFVKNLALPSLSLFRVARI